MQDTQPLSGRKLRFLLEYFMKIVKEMPRGVVTFRRISYGKCLDIPEIEKRMDKAMVVFFKSIILCSEKARPEFNAKTIYSINIV